MSYIQHAKLPDAMLLIATTFLIDYVSIGKVQKLNRRRNFSFVSFKK